eukprot:3768187-Pyramimonas_sp.AAC.2
MMMRIAGARNKGLEGPCAVVAARRLAQAALRGGGRMPAHRRSKTRTLFPAGTDMAGDAVHLRDKPEHAGVLR